MTTTELTVIERAAIALSMSERETELRALVTKSNDIVEIKNSAGRDQCHAAAMLLRAARMSIRKVGKDARDDATKFSKAVIAEEDRLVALIEPEETRLLGMRNAWDEAREAEKRAKLEAAQRRVASIREHIDDIRSFAQRAVGAPSASIAMWIEELQELGITLDRFAEMTGEAEAVRDATLDKLRELHAASVTQETEAARLAAEREELERQRAELAAQREREEAERAERERVEAAARAEQERIDREHRDAEEAERRAAMAAEEARLAEQRAEQERRQAELDRAEREQREREEAAAQEAAEAAAQAERDRVARQRAENRTAMLAPEPTGGNWTAKSGCVVTDVPIPGCVGGGFEDVEHYGGYLIAESIYRPADGYVLAAAREMLEILQAVSEWLYDTNANDELRKRVDGVLTKATYQPDAIAA
ncbi:hypothetical protein [Burkholderia pseudomallei]|uniref:hypothetical protein n=1 Tax=Burkholderia pseudomallei TaxID=28450 RepID=UPI00211675C6|nr:hypothetical protein [Burkholderia pseudomallei]